MASSQMKHSAADEQKLFTDLLSLANSPIDFVKYVYPWGQRGTPLESLKGPRGWQLESLQEIERHIRSNSEKAAIDLPPEMLNGAVCSGRGIGKSAELSMIDHWFMSTTLGGTSITTANTEQQLRSRTWPERGKWLTMAINGHWFDYTATSIKPAPWFAELIKQQLKIDTQYYYSMAQTWSEEDPDAFAGAHNANGMLVIFDEASGISHKIWTVTEGFFTEPTARRFWLVRSNGRRNTGAFFECFNRDRDHWRNRHIDARTVEGTDRAIYDKIIVKYGAESDEARVEVYGQFPNSGQRQFISTAKVQEAVNRELNSDPGAALVMGVDVARFGDDKTVIRFRQGRNGRDVPGPFKYKGMDNMQVAYEVADKITRYSPDAVFIDAGAGAGVIDRLRDLKYKVIPVQFGAKSSKPEWYLKRTEMWAAMRDWVYDVGCLPDDAELITDLTVPEYEYKTNEKCQALETKDSIKARGYHSPDDGDALALTFANPVARLDMRSGRRRGMAVARGTGYDVF